MAEFVQAHKLGMQQRVQLCSCNDLLNDAKELDIYIKLTTMTVVEAEATGPENKDAVINALPKPGSACRSASWLQLCHLRPCASTTGIIATPRRCCGHIAAGMPPTRSRPLLGCAQGVRCRFGEQIPGTIATPWPGNPILDRGFGAASTGAYPKPSMPQDVGAISASFSEALH